MNADILDMLDEWADSIELFVDECLFGNIDGEMSQQQREVLQDIDSGSKQIAIKSGHGTGKTVIQAWVMMWVGLFKYDAKNPATAPTASQLSVLLLPEVEKWRRNLPEELKNAIVVKSDTISFETGNMTVARTARKEAPEGLQGFHASFLLWIVDEASGVPLPIFEVIDGSLTGDDYLYIMTANPTRTSGYFFDAFNKNSSLWSLHTFNAEESENVSKASIERKKVQYGEDSDEYRVRVLGQFPMLDTDALFSYDLIRKSMIDRDDIDREGVKTVTIDVARYGDDDSVTSKRRGMEIFGMVAKHGLNTTEIASWGAKVARELDEDMGIDAVVVDGTGGYGGGVVDKMLPLGLPIIEAIYSNAATDNRYLNKRAEMYYNLRAWMERGGKLPKDTKLEEELMATSYAIQENGKVKLIPKQAIKEDIGRSPDRADSVAMHFFEEITPINEEFTPKSRVTGW